MVETPSMYPALGALQVADAMHPGLISCSLETPLRSVARMMATYRVHAILVVAHGGDEAEGPPWVVVTEADLLRAAAFADVDDEPALAIAATPVLTVGPSDGLAAAAELMVEHELSHLIVVEPQAGRPIGVLSTLDVARAIAAFPERHPAGS